MRPVLSCPGWVFIVSCTLFSTCSWGETSLPSPYRSGPGLYPRFEAKQADEGISYGEAGDFPLPKTLLYSVGADELVADATAWVERGFQGFFLTGVAGEWSSDVWATDGEPWSIGDSDKTLQKVRQGIQICNRLGAEVFLSVSYSHYFEWFNELAWPHIENKFRQFAVFARESGCKGLAIDVEYIWPQYHFHWDGYTYEGYTREDLVRMIRQRMTGVARVLYKTFPDMVLLTLPEQSFSLGNHIQTAWIEEAAARRAPGGVHICTEYTYRRPNLRYMLGHTWMVNTLMHRLLSPIAHEYWRKNCSIAEGLWPFGIDPEDFHGAAPTLDEFRQGYAASLMGSSRYNWIYSHNLRPFMLGRETQDYASLEEGKSYMDIISKREVVTDPQFLGLANKLRTLELEDFSQRLGLEIVPTFAGPKEEVEVGLMPADIYQSAPIRTIRDQVWAIGEGIWRGEDVDARSIWGTQTEWLILGPFPNMDKQAFHTAFPPELNLDLGATYEGVGKQIGWEHRIPSDTRAAVNLAKMIEPSEEVCAYALAWVESATEVSAQIRAGANDQWKIWVGGKLVFDCEADGRMILDREIIPIVLPKGRTPVLVRICNNKKDWGFILRITDAVGSPIPGLVWGMEP